MRFLLARTLKTRLIFSYLVILGIGGLATSLVGSWIVSATIMEQARRRVDSDLATARFVYQQQLDRLRNAVRLTAAGAALQHLLVATERSAPVPELENIRREASLDFLTVTDPRGRVVLRMTQPQRTGDDLSANPVIEAALDGRVAAATEILTPESLALEDPRLRDRARLRIVETRRSRAHDRDQETSGMALVAAAPVLGSQGEIAGVLYAGTLLNRNLRIVDQVWELIYRDEVFRGREVGTVTVFQNDLRIATTVKTAAGERALGTRVSAEVFDAVITRGETWRDRAFVVDDWYISAYEPIKNLHGEIVGMLYVGLLEKAYSSIRNRVILSFFAIATLGFALIIAVTYRMIENVTRPLGEMVAATRTIAAGRFDREVRATSQDEIGQLAVSFNYMLESLRQMKSDLEEWGRTLEQKVEERTEELVAMQKKLAASERLAALGKLAAGVAHEINNPLGGIMALTALTLEETPEGDPDRENLEEVLNQTERCRDIVRGLLDFSRQSELTRKPVDLNRILRETLALVKKQALFFNIEVVERWDSDLPAVLADESQLQQVFMNIIINAAEAMRERGTLTVTTRRAAGGDNCETLVADTGHGIPPDALDRIFDPFFTSKAEEKGTGLGLSIAYGIVAKHGGTITAESEVGKGSTFTVRLPAAR